MSVEININGRKANTLLRTNVPTSGDPYKAYADTEYEKKKKKEHENLVNEINRRNFDDYGV
jgi:hypothetical protein